MHVGIPSSSRWGRGIPESVLKAKGEGFHDILCTNAGGLVHISNGAGEPPDTSFLTTRAGHTLTAQPQFARPGVFEVAVAFRFFSVQFTVVSASAVSAFLHADRPLDSIKNLRENRLQHSVPVERRRGVYEQLDIHAIAQRSRENRS